jgi:AraC-like DNA-binding protein
MLARRMLLDRDGVTIADVACRHRAGRGRESEPSGGYALVFVRRGCFARRADGSKEVLDPTVAYCITPGQEQRYDHPGDGGDDCTTIALDVPTVASLWGGEPGLPTVPLPVSPRLDLEHRRLLIAARRQADPDTLYEHAINLAAVVVQQHDLLPVAADRPQTRSARRRLVRDTREALATEPGRTLPQLARELAVSPHHLSRVFRADTGHTISRYRLLLRARTALELIAGGERNLARMAAELGFADQSHLCRAIHNQTGHTPTAVRKLLA